MAVLLPLINFASVLLSKLLFKRTSALWPVFYLVSVVGLTQPPGFGTTIEPSTERSANLMVAIIYLSWMRLILRPLVAA